jgi:putative ABC transport system permease protein
MITHDLRHAFKALVRRPGLSLAVLLILALGIGSTTMICSIASSVLLSKIPYKDGDRLVTIKLRREQDGSPSASSYLDVESWREQSRTLAMISINSNYQQLNLTGGDRAERINVGFASASYFDLLGIHAARGRTFRPEDENRASPPAVTVLSHDLWQRRYGGDPAIVGQSIRIQGLPFQVVGVLPEGFRDIFQEIGLYVPVTIARLTHRAGFVDDRMARWLAVFARLRPGVSLGQADQEMRSIAQRLAITFPDSNLGYVASVHPLRTYQFDFERMRLSILTLLIGAAFVVLVGCTNVTNLLLLRAVERRKEVALRLALGVSRPRLIRQFVLEGAILCLAGAVLGVGAAFFAVGLLDKFGTYAYNLPDFIHFSVDLRALVAAVLLALLISFVNGVVPARESLKVDLQAELQSEGKGHSPSAGTAFTRSLLVVSAIFFSVVLLIGAGLVIKSLQALMQSDPGFRVDHVLSARFELPTTQYPSDEKAYLLYRRLIEQARALPDVEEAGIWAPGMLGASIFLQFIVPEGRSIEAPEAKIRIYEHRVSPGLLRNSGITLLAGREFTEQDDPRHPRVAVVSRSTAEALWPSQDPLRKRFWMGAPHNVWVEVVGIASDADQRGRLLPDHNFRRDAYFPLFQMRSRTASILLRVRQDGSEVRKRLSQVMQTIAPDIPVYDIQTLQERRRNEEASVRFNVFLLLFFASSALLLAVIGIYSILVYSVRQQSFEIRVRMAVGANQSHILRRFFWQGTILLGIGLIAGLTGALGLARVLSSILFHVNPHDPLVFITVPCLIALLTLPVILRPAYRATKGDPSSLLRLK